jgi:aminoglycoside/choline kinase family phosphotransferase
LTTRDEEIGEALEGAGWGDWRVGWLAADASARRYARLVHGDGRSAILMDMGPDPAPAQWQPFVQIAAALREAGLAAPALLADLTPAGVMVWEDLGPDTFAAHLAQSPGEEPLVYAAAVQVLVRLAALPPPPGLPALNPTRGAGMVAPLFDHYATGLDARTRARITGALQDVLAAHAQVADRLSLRDFHAENLIWRPTLAGTDRVGLLDFQDAFVAPAAYDLTSLLRDARRDVDPELAVRMTDAFAQGAGLPVAEVIAQAACLGVQRNLRILGIFARLALVEGKTRYLSLIPRVWAHLQADLSHPALADVAPLLRLAVPAP